MIITSKEDFTTKLEKINKELKSIPLFIKEGDTLELLPTFNSENIKENNAIVYLGKKLEV